ncbi:MAG TPA: citrate/2-methylcitrate synthase, partial [Deinococcales bacterium]|nr:citrate/2-methylcitrate synthase [Deinococcales bacterium]
PTGDELSAFDASLRERRALPQPVLEAMRAFPRETHPMQALRSAVSLLGMHDPESESQTPEGKLEIALKLIAQVATVVAALHRLREGLEPVPPRADLTHAGNFLYMLQGEVPSEEQARLFDIALILHADHGMNASTFTGIATASTLSDMYSCVTAAVGALKGPLHGGANEAVMDMLDEIGSVDRAPAFITGKLDRKEKIMGVGHRVYKFFDPRSRVLKDYAAVVANKHGKSDRYQILETVEQIVVNRLSTKGIYPNVDFYSGVVYSDLGIPKSFFTPIFAVARVSGWMASIIEYTSSNRILRPDALYVGPAEARWVPVDER